MSPQTPCSCGGDRETGYEHNMNCKGFWPPAYIELRKQLRSVPPLSTNLALGDALAGAKADAAGHRDAAERFMRQRDDARDRIRDLEAEIEALKRAHETSDEHLRALYSWYRMG